MTKSNCESLRDATAELYDMATDTNRATCERVESYLELAVLWHRDSRKSLLFVNDARKLLRENA